MDTSALAAILFQEPDAGAMLAALEAADRSCIAAPTKFELLLVMGRWRAEPAQEAARDLLLRTGLDVVDWTDELADIAAQAFLQYGKGRHRAALNFGDCMAYALAKSLDAPLLYKGNDFSLTDIRSAA